MTLYDEPIDRLLELVPADSRRFDYRPTTLPMDSSPTVLLGRDTAYELGGSQTPCVSTLAVSSGRTFDNSVTLVGPDLTEIRRDCSFGKVVLLQIEDVQEQAAFDCIKELERLRYSFAPTGLMTRASAYNMREQIRVSKAAVKSGLSFADYGRALLGAYLQRPEVYSGQVLIFTDRPSLDTLSALAEKIRSTTDALNHILDDVLLDCKSCNLKPICDQVEGMRELHFSRQKAKRGKKE